MLDSIVIFTVTLDVNEDFQFLENKAQILEDAKLFTIMPVISGPYSVDSFFYLRYVDENI